MQEDKESSKKTASAITREEWLTLAVQFLEPLFSQQGYTLPEVRVSCGFPSTGGRSHHIGQCFSRKSSDTGLNEIFVSPRLADSLDVLDTLMHELVHAVDDCANAHGPEFKKIALAVGLEGKMRQAGAGEKLKARLSEIASKLSPYPHGKLNIQPRIRERRPRPRARCKECGYEIAVPRKWLHIGPPLCPIHKEEMEQIGTWEDI